VEKPLVLYGRGVNERHAMNEQWDFCFGFTAAGVGDAGGRSCRWMAAAPRGSCCACARRPHFAAQWLDQEFVERIRAPVSGVSQHLARTITPLLLMTGQAAHAAGASRRLPATCPAAPVTGDLACALGSDTAPLPLANQISFP